MRAAQLWPIASREESDTRNHLRALRRAARLAGTVIELGVHTGRSTVAFLTGLEERGDGWLWSLDERPAEQLTGYSARLYGEHPVWTYYTGWSTHQSSLDAAPGSCRLLFIDTTHTLDITLAELILWTPKVDPGGSVYLHDTRFASEPDGRCGVALAVAEWRADHPDWGWSEDSSWPGLGTLVAPR